MRYVVYSKVLKVEEQKEPKVGWFVHFEGSWESIFLGEEKPAFEPGDTVKITFEKSNKGARP